MLNERIITFLIICVTPFSGVNTNEQNLGTGSVQDFTVYFLRTQHPLSEYDSALIPSIEEAILARNYEKKNLGTFDRDWTRNILTESEYGTSLEDKCKHSNGNCSHICETVGNQAICSCNEGFSVLNDTFCHPIEPGNVVLSGTSGKFRMHGENAWIIKAPKNHIIELDISGEHRFRGSYDVYDIDSSDSGELSPYESSWNMRQYRSFGPQLRIQTDRSWTHHDDVIATYKTGLPRFTSSDSDEELRVLPISTGLICYSVTHRSGKMLNVYYRDGYRQTSLTSHLFFVHHRGLWTTSVFQTEIPHKDKALYFEFPDDSSQLLMLRECLDIEYPFSKSESVIVSGLDAECENGGVWNRTHGLCMCPPGFVGANCEEGCGANRYGANCTETCSILSTECGGAIFCKENSCTCAPGFHGKSCDIPCPNGFYGAMCQQSCGKCKDDSPCDRYTGKCYSGCAPGYYPPLCQKTYKVLKSAPEILAIGHKYVKFRALMWDQHGQGHPKFYEVQYKAEDDELWSRLTPRKVSNEAEVFIDNLLSGHLYSVRIILIDQDGGSCELHVPETKVMTKCREPHEAVYSLAATQITEDELTLEWSYTFDRNADFCLIKEFELSLLSENRQLIITSLLKGGIKTLSGLLPNTDYRINLIGVTQTGIRVPSPEITARTLPADPGKVVNVQIVPQVSSRELKVTWQPPWSAVGEKTKYLISYKCLRILACERMDHNLSTQNMVVETTSALLGGLQPHAVYQIEIAAMPDNGLTSEGYIMNTTTEDTAPHVAPTAAENPILGVTNVSSSICWLPPRDCASLNGYLYGYSCKLVDNETGEIMKESTVQENVHSVNFTTLKPDHCYEAQIAVISSGGIDFSNSVVIPFCTSLTAPDEVQFLKVYKKSRKMVGLKWDKPLNTYGEIDSFIISYSTHSTDSKIKTTVKPQHCHAWPNSYCHTVSHLLPGRNYSFTVQARNDKVNADGEPSSVEAVTTEGVATAPVNLTVVNATESSVTLKWQLPENINGFLRSFIIMTAQVDTKGMSDECCDSIPLSDYRITSEEPYYRYEINGLSAASTYSVTVAAKTLSLGEEARIIAHTQPPNGLLTNNAIEVVGTEENTDHSVTVSLKVHPAKKVNGVKRTYYVLLLSNTTSTEHSIEDKYLRTLLEARFTDKYHLISKYTQDELEKHTLILFHTGDLGFEDVDIHSCRYALVMIQDYKGNISVDISVSGIY